MSILRPAMFAASTARNRVGTAAAARKATASVGQSLHRIGVREVGKLAGPVAEALLGQLGTEVTRYRRGGYSELLKALESSELQGLGRAIAWILRGRRGAPKASATEVRTAREIVNKITPPPRRPPANRVTPMRPTAPGSPTNRVTPGLPAGRQPAPSMPGGRAELPPMLPPSREVTGDVEQPIPGAGAGRGGGTTGRGRIPGNTSREPPGGGNDGPPDPPGNPNRLEMIRSPQSSNVHSYGYMAETATLYVCYLATHFDPSKVKQTKIKGGVHHTSVPKGARGGRAARPGPTYAYDGVPQRVFDRMRAAISKGIFVWDELRVRGSIWRHQFPYRLVNPGEAFKGGNSKFIYVPRRASKKGFRARTVTMANGMTILSSMSRSTARRGAVRNR